MLLFPKSRDRLYGWVGIGFDFLATTSGERHGKHVLTCLLRAPSQGGLWVHECAGWHGGEGCDKTVWGTLSSIIVQEDLSSHCPSLWSSFPSSHGGLWFGHWGRPHPALTVPALTVPGCLYDKVREKQLSREWWPPENRRKVDLLDKPSRCLFPTLAGNFFVWEYSTRTLPNSLLPFCSLQGARNSRSL